MEWTLQNLKPHNREAMLSLLREANLPRYWNAEALSTLLSNASVRAIGLALQEALNSPHKMGALALGFESHETMDLLLLATDRPYQRLGLAAYLLKQLEAQTPCTRIVLEVSLFNTKARQLYEKHGYRTINLRRHYYGAEHHALVLEKRVAKECLALETTFVTSRKD